MEGRADGIFREEPGETKVPGIFRAEPGEAQLPGIIHKAPGILEIIESSEKAAVIPPDIPSEKVYIDEIKGVYRDVLSLKEPVMIHLAQAKWYAYIYGSQNDLQRIHVQMTYCNLETEEVRRFRQGFTLKELGDWFFDVVGQYQKWGEHQKRWREIRQASLKELMFPFPWREGQKEVASSVYRTMLRRKKLFIQAPTGTGKTISTIFPAVKAVGEGLADRIFYATAKTITRTVAEDTYEILRRQGMRLKSITLTAKEKICFLEETQCNPEACPYAKGHFDRVNDAVFDMIQTEEVFSRPVIERYAKKWQVCPFEFGLDVSLWADACLLYTSDAADD